MSAGARFATGDWYAVVGDRVTVLLPSSQRGRVAGLWDLADSGARGAATANVSSAGGDEIVTAAAGTTWSEKVLTGASSVRVTPTGDGAAGRTRRAARCRRRTGSGAAAGAHA